MRTKVQSDSRHQIGSIRLMLILLVVGLFMLCAGGQKLYTAATNRKPTVMGFADYAKSKSSAAWLTLTNCQLNLVHCCYLSYAGDNNAGKQDTYYIPVFDPASDSKEVCVLLKSRNPTYLKTIKEMTDLHTEQEAETWGRQNRDRILPHANITGLVVSGMDMKDQERQEIAKTQKNIAENFVIIDEDAQPSFAAGAGCMAGGVASLGCLVVYFRKRNQ